LRVVVKVGSSSLHDGNNPIWENFDSIASQLKTLRESGYEVVLVTSGAIAFGRAEQKIDLLVDISIPEKQALASVGQISLMRAWCDVLEKHDIHSGQVLVTNEVLGSSTANQKSHLVDTFEQLFTLGVLPIVNENDAVAVAEIVQGDNDKLSALIANIVNARDLYILGTASAVLQKYPDVKSRINSVSLKEIDFLRTISVGTEDPQATGGMVTKIEASQLFLSDNNNDNKKSVFVAEASTVDVISKIQVGKVGTKITLR